MNILFLILIGIVFGAVIMFATMKLINCHKASMAAFEKRIADLEAQIKGKQLPFFVRDGLEDIKALENEDSFDLARIRLYLEEMLKTVDQAADRQTRMGTLYNLMRNHKKVEKK